MSLSNTFITRPVLTTVCSLLIVIAGLIAIPILPIENLPDIAPPTVQVSSRYVGADAVSVEQGVTSVLEQQITVPIYQKWEGSRPVVLCAHLGHKFGIARSASWVDQPRFQVGHGSVVQIYVERVDASENQWICWHGVSEHLSARQIPRGGDGAPWCDPIAAGQRRRPRLPLPARSEPADMP
jgi:hypothetical protein